MIISKVLYAQSIADKLSVPKQFSVSQQLFELLANLTSYPLVQQLSFQSVQVLHVYGVIHQFVVAALSQLQLHLHRLAQPQQKLCNSATCLLWQLNLIWKLLQVSAPRPFVVVEGSRVTIAEFFQVFPDVCVNPFVCWP